MILKHPTENKTAQVRSGSLRCNQLVQDGWVDITPPRTELQQKTAKKWQRMGTLARTIANLQAEHDIKYNATLAQTITLLRNRLAYLREGG